MGFQTTVSGDLKSGVIGEISHDSPMRAVPAVLDSGAGAANNVVGRFFTYIDEAAETVQAGGTVGAANAMAGILILPKTHALRGTTVGGTLADSLLLPDGTPADFLQKGEIFVSLATTGATIGAAVKYNTTTGVLDHGAPGAGEAVVPNAVVARHNASPTDTAAFLAVISLNN